MYSKSQPLFPKGNVCASACASILFISARIHKVEEGGRLAFHPCRAADAPNDLCSEAISKNAFYHGTPFSSIMAFMKSSIFNQLRTDFVHIDRSGAILWGLYGPPTHDPTLAIPSIDCSKETGVAEQLVCTNPQLARYDASAERIYALLSSIASPTLLADMKQRKLRWKESLTSCDGSYSCLLESYATWRLDLRSTYVRARMSAAIKPFEHLSLKEAPNNISLALKTLGSCGDEKNPVSHEILEHSCEFMMENVAMRLIENELTGKFNGNSNCVFTELCASNITTVDTLKLKDNFLEISQVIEKNPEKAYEILTNMDNYIGRKN